MYTCQLVGFAQTLQTHGVRRKSPYVWSKMVQGTPSRKTNDKIDQRTMPKTTATDTPGADTGSEHRGNCKQGFEEIKTNNRKICFEENQKMLIQKYVATYCRPIC